MVQREGVAGHKWLSFEGSLIILLFSLLPLPWVASCNKLFHSGVSYDSHGTQAGGATVCCPFWPVMPSTTSRRTRQHTAPHIAYYMNMSDTYVRSIGGAQQCKSLSISPTTQVTTLPLPTSVPSKDIVPRLTSWLKANLVLR